MKRRSVAAASGLRAALAASYETLIEQHATTIAAAAGTFRCPWPEQLEALRSGEPVVVPGWKILGACRKAGIEAPGKIDPQVQYRLDERGLLSREPWLSPEPFA